MPSDYTLKNPLYRGAKPPFSDPDIFSDVLTGWCYGLPAKYVADKIGQGTARSIASVYSKLSQKLYDIRLPTVEEYYKQPDGQWGLRPVTDEEKLKDYVLFFASDEGRTATKQEVRDVSETGEPARLMVKVLREIRKQKAGLSRSTCLYDFAYAYFCENNMHAVRTVAPPVYKSFKEGSLAENSILFKANPSMDMHVLAMVMYRKMVYMLREHPL